MTQVSAIGDHGHAVDWWFMYKIAGKCVMSNGAKASGTEYMYFDSTQPQGSKLNLSPYTVADAKHGALSNTLNQIYSNPGNPELGWFFYNDEDPITNTVNSSRGHTKGVLCFDLASNSAFWLIHSAPKFPPKDAYAYPETATGYGQTLLCITLQDADVAKVIAGQMVEGQQPSVYLASSIPKSLQNQATDPRVSLLQNKVSTGGQAYANFISFKSKAGMSFRSIAKNKEWTTAAGNDFYNDLVGPVLHESLELETWEHGHTPGNLEADKVHQIMAMKTVDLAPLGLNPSYKWSEENDHAKLVISQQSEKQHFVCVGDINFTLTMEKRSGGTVAFQSEDLWKSLVEILSEVNLRKSKSTEKAPEQSGSKKVPTK